MKHPRTSLSLVATLGMGVACASCAGILGIDELSPQPAEGQGYTVTFVAGGGQSGQVGKPLAQPLVVEVRDAKGVLAVQRPVTFAAVAGGGYFVDKVKQDTDAQGRATIQWVLGPAAQNEVRATAEGATASATATVTDPWQLGIAVGQMVGRMFRDGRGQDARFGEPDGLAFGGDGKLYIGDTLAQTVLRFDPGSGDVKTIAGSPGLPGNAAGDGAAARFAAPFGVAREGTGRLLVASTNSHILQRIELKPATATVTYLAGAGTAGAQDGTGQDATFNLPYALDVDDAKNVAYLADFGNHVIRQIALDTGAVRTIVGTAGKPGYSGESTMDALLTSPTGVTHNGDTLYVSEAGNARIRQIDLSTRRVSVLSGAADTGPVGGYADGDRNVARYRNPVGIAYLNGRLYVADRSTHSIRSISAADGSVTTIAGSPPSAGDPKFGNTDGKGTAARLFQPHSVAISPDGTSLYFSEAGGTDVRRMVLGGDFDVVTVAGKAVVPTNGHALTEAVLDWPRGLALAKNKLIFTEATGHAVRQLDFGTKLVSRLAGADDESGGVVDGPGPTARFGFPIALAADEAKGVVYVTGADQTVREVALATGETKTIAGRANTRGFADASGTNALFQDPLGMALDASGQKLYLADTGNHRIRVIDLTSAEHRVSTLAGSSAGFADGASIEAHFRSPRSLVVKDKVLYVADGDNQVLRRIELDPTGYGRVSTFGGTPGKAGQVDGPLADALFTSPGSLALQGDLLYVADIETKALRRVHLPSETVSTLLGGGGQAGGPAAMELGPLTMPKKPAHLVVRPNGEVLFTTYEENVVFRLGPP